MTSQAHRIPPRRHPMLAILIVLLLAGLITAGLLSFYGIGQAYGQTVMDDAGVGSGSAAMVGSAMMGSAAGSAAVAPSPAADPISELKAMKAKYDMLKAAKSGDPKMLLWAGMLAAICKLLLSIVNLVAKGKPARWLGWAAMGLAVPIALLSYFAMGNSLFDSLIYAGAGPGAVIVHELMKALTKKTSPA